MYWRLAQALPIPAPHGASGGADELVSLGVAVALVGLLLYFSRHKKS